MSSSRKIVVMIDRITVDAAFSDDIHQFEAELSASLSSSLRLHAISGKEWSGRPLRSHEARVVQMRLPAATRSSNAALLGREIANYSNAWVSRHTSRDAGHGRKQ
jgi:hypothetical protein